MSQTEVTEKAVIVSRSPGGEVVTLRSAKPPRVGSIPTQDSSSRSERKAWEKCACAHFVWNRTAERCSSGKTVSIYCFTAQRSYERSELEKVGRFPKQKISDRQDNSLFLKQRNAQVVKLVGESVWETVSQGPLSPEYINRYLAK